MTAPVQQHGGLRPRELAALGIDAAGVMDFSASISPIGLPKGVREAIAATDPVAYPDPDCTRLVGSLSQRLDVPPEQILVGNGSTQLIHLLTRVFVRQGQRPIALAPTFGEYAVATELAGGNLYTWQAQPQRGFRWNLKNKPDVLRRVAPPLVFLCNPNNPTGVYLSYDEVRSLSSALVSGPLLLDEAYAGFLNEHWRPFDLVRKGRVIVVRSLTKDHALAGLRLGYLVAHPDVVSAARRFQPAWSVSSVAQAAGVAALADEGYPARMRAAVGAAKRVLVDGLRALGFAVHEGTVNFVLVETGDATAFRLRLLRAGFAVRDCTSFGLPGYVRISVRSVDDCRALLAALTRLQESAAATAAADGGIAGLPTLGGPAA